MLYEGVGSAPYAMTTQTMTTKKASYSMYDAFPL